MSKASCLPCPSGKVSVAGSDSCETCLVGTYSSNSDNDADGFGLTAGATFCASCPPGRINPVKSATQCSACAAGYSSEMNATECFKCGERVSVSLFYNACFPSYWHFYVRSSLESFPFQFAVILARCWQICRVAGNACMPRL